MHVDVPGMQRVRRAVLLSFHGDRDPELALSPRSFSQSRHDGEDVLRRALPAFTEQVYRLSRFTLLPPEFITATTAYRAYSARRLLYARIEEMASVPKLKILNAEEDAKVIGALLKAAGVESGICVQGRMFTVPRLAEGDTGSVGGRVRLQVWMFDDKGRLLWGDVVEGNSEALARVSGGSYTFPQEITKVLAEAFERASEEVVRRLARRLP